MISVEELSSLLATLYAAPLEPDKWQLFLDRLCALTDTASSYIVAVRPEQGNVALSQMEGSIFDPETLHLYNEHYGASDPYAGPTMATPGSVLFRRRSWSAALISSGLNSTMKCCTQYGSSNT